jgi:hypothetical protein
MPAAVMPDDGQASFFDEAPEQMLQQKHVNGPRGETDLSRTP